MASNILLAGVSSCRPIALSRRKRCAPEDSPARPVVKRACVKKDLPVGAGRTSSDPFLSPWEGVVAVDADVRLYAIKG